jgi:FMN phosphatase YigB (HAD superfamily)
MAAAVLERLGLAAAGSAMAGDRLSTGMAMANSAGMAGVLVLTGAGDRGRLGRLAPADTRYRGSRRVGFYDRRRHLRGAAARPGGKPVLSTTRTHVRILMHRG